EEVKMAQVRTERFQMILLALFAAIGLLLGAAGIYGLLAYSVAQRTREIGIRLALGAARYRILGAVVRDGALLALIGVVICAAAAAAFAHTLRTFVWGVSTLDPLTYVAVAAILIGVSVLASLVPALRAVRLDPGRTLRE